MARGIGNIALILFMMWGMTVFAQNNGQNQEVVAYIEKYKDLAMEEMVNNKIPASVKLAQAILESRHGTSELAVKSNNHFCIKCHSSWTGKKTYYDDDAKGECFRVYNSVEESYRDHSNFLKNGSRYAFLFDLKITDYRAWAKGLKKAGYATSPVYASALIKIIEDYNLQQYDQMVVNNKFKPKKKQKEIKKEVEKKSEETPKSQKINKKQVKEVVGAVPVLSDCKVVAMTSDHHYIRENFGVKFVLTKDGDDIENLAKELKISKKQLWKYNNLNQTKTTFTAGEVLYIGPKRYKAASGYNAHVVKPGETLSKISQLYAVKLQRLFKMNGLDETSKLHVGDTIILR